MKFFLFTILTVLTLTKAVVASNKDSIKDICIKFSLQMINETEAMKRLELPNFLFGEEITSDDYYRAVSEYCLEYKNF